MSPGRSRQRVLVTGGAGFIGSRLARRLDSVGHDVVVLDNLLPQVHGVVSDFEPGVNALRADVRDVERVAEVMQGVEVVHHLAAETGVGQSQYEIGRYVGTNTYGTGVVLEAAVAAGVSQLVIASSRAVYGEGHQSCPSCVLPFASVARRISDLDAGQWAVLCPQCRSPALPIATPEDSPTTPISLYGLTKLQQEQLATIVGRTHDLAVTILRLFNVYGPGQSVHNPYVGILGTFVRRVQAQQPIEVYEDGAMLRDFVFIDDVVEVLLRCSGNEDAFGRTWNVGSSQPISLLDVARSVLQATGLTTDIRVSGRYRVGDVRHVLADTSRLEADLGYRPSTPFAEGLAKFVRWARASGSDASDTTADDHLTSRRLLRQGRQ